MKEKWWLPTIKTSVSCWTNKTVWFVLWNITLSYNHQFWLYRKANNCLKVYHYNLNLTDFLFSVFSTYFWRSDMFFSVLFCYVSLKTLKNKSTIEWLKCICQHIWKQFLWLNSDPMFSISSWLLIPCLLHRFGPIFLKQGATLITVSSLRSELYPNLRLEPCPLLFCFTDASDANYLSESLPVPLMQWFVFPMKLNWYPLWNLAPVNHLVFSHQ